MSASREKKVRQEQAANGYVDPKIQRENEQKKAEKKSRILYTSIAVVFVVVALGLFVWKSGIFQKNATAVSIDGEKYTAADVSFYSRSIYTYYYNYCQSVYGSGSYVSYFLTADTLKEAAVQNLTETVNLYNAAIKAGYEKTEEDQQTIDSAVESMESAAKANNYSKANYLKALYGNTMTEKVFLKNLEMSTIATSYGQQVKADFSYTVADLESYFNENENNFRYCDYEQFFVSSSADTVDENGNTVEASEEDAKAAVEAAAATAQAVLEKFQAGEELKALSESEEYKDLGTYSHNESGSYSESDLMKWLFDKSRKDNDSTVITVEGSGSYVLVFHSCTRNDYNTVDVRHILVEVDKSGLDASSDTYDADLSKLQDEAKVKAQALLDEWKAGDATAESFGALADANSSDSSAGGLYEKVYKGQMVTEFNDWIFDPARKSGDTGLVLTTYGYHVMYFVGENVPYWQVQVESAKRSADYNNWYDALCENQTVEQGSGMKYVETYL